MLAATETSTPDLVPVHPFTVGVVVVTFNRCALLRDTLEHLNHQGYPIEHIFVIDNASTDGTRQFLEGLKMPRCEAHFMKKNLGGAGGFSAGIEIAYASGVDLIWVMDDDVLPSKDALEKLIVALSKLREKGAVPNFLISNVFNSEGEPVNSPIADMRIQKNGNMRFTALLEDRILPIVGASFVGTLITRDAVSRFGLPIAEMFIWGDDVEYTQRLSQEREAGYVVGDSKIVHLGRGVELSLAGESDPTRAARFFYYYRNNVYGLRKYGNKQRKVSFALATAREFFKLLGRGDFGKLTILSKGLVAGLFFNPSIKKIDPVLPSCK
jgi:GT2 family glycosyltransferase